MQTTTQATCPVCRGAGSIKKTVKGEQKQSICQHCRGTGKAGKLQTK
jgi:DnaJ-class molecular chaperone